MILLVIIYFKQNSKEKSKIKIRSACIDAKKSETELFPPLKLDINPHAGVGLFGQYKILQKTWLKPWQMDTHLIILYESYPMNTNRV